MPHRPSRLCVVMSALAAVVSTCSDEVESEGEDTIERCADGIDNDHDGLEDCADPRCQMFPRCASADGDSDSDSDADTDADTDADSDGGAVGDAGMDAGAPDLCRDVNCPPEQQCVAGACLDFGCDPPCGEGNVCSSGECVDRDLDQDADGYSAEFDCDDLDSDLFPGSHTTCSTACGQGISTCELGRWSDCTAPTECVCAPQEVLSVPCGRCGHEDRTCDDEGTWRRNATGCLDKGECSPDARQVEACAESECRRSRTCGLDCVWGDWGPCEGICE